MYRRKGLTNRAFGCGCYYSVINGDTHAGTAACEKAGKGHSV